jgi:hypothetical protein
MGCRRCLEQINTANVTSPEHHQEVLILPSSCSNRLAPRSKGLWYHSSLVQHSKLRKSFIYMHQPLCTAGFGPTCSATPQLSSASRNRGGIYSMLGSAPSRTQRTIGSNHRGHPLCFVFQVETCSYLPTALNRKIPNMGFSHAHTVIHFPCGLKLARSCAI